MIFLPRKLHQTACVIASGRYYKAGFYMDTEIKYPRRIFLRHLLRRIARVLVFLLARAQIAGRKNFPKKGPVILVGNHTAALEVVMMAIYPPKQVEFMGSTDIPHEGIMNTFVGLYGLIPVFRGNVTPSSMKMGVQVLKQDGMLGIFPEGGIWEPSIRRAQSGVAWLSYHAQAPVLPIGFGDMAGLLGEVFAFKRPVLKMNVGELIPPVQKPSGKSRKQHFQDESDRIMDAVWELIPAEDRQRDETIRDESFELLVEIQDEHGELVGIPTEFEPEHGAAFSKFTHRNTLINNYIKNLEMPHVAILTELVDAPSIDAILQATRSIFQSLQDDNPYYFTYRYGQKEGKAMENGIREVQELALWAQENDLQIKFTPLRRFTYLPTGEDVVVDRTQPMDKW
jgi:1-acyl-sn-glycerol-3-phosphate acyltransferase